jgi:hypothetical protein
MITSYTFDLHLELEILNLMNMKNEPSYLIKESLNLL